MSFWIALGISCLLYAAQGFQYEVTVRTGDVECAGTNADVFIKLIGQNGESEMINVEKIDEGRHGWANDLKEGEEAKFPIETAQQLGPIQAVEVSLVKKGRYPAWFLQDVEIYSPDTNTRQTFPFNSWLDDKGPYSLSARLTENGEEGGNSGAGTGEGYCFVGDRNDLKDLFLELVSDLSTTAAPCPTATVPQCPPVPTCPPVAECPKCPTVTPRDSLSELSGLCEGAAQSASSRAVVHTSAGVAALCDTNTDQGGWIIILRRVNGDVNFERNWTEYRNGFGDIEGQGNFWFGLDNMHRLTTDRSYELRVDFTYNGKDYYATYSTFRVLDGGENYKLEVSGYHGNAGDNMAHHNGAMFSTRDRPNDNNGHCTEWYWGGWWYNNCHEVYPTGTYGSKKGSQGLNWKDVTGFKDSATFMEMKIRPVD